MTLTVFTSKPSRRCNKAPLTIFLSPRRGERIKERGKSSERGFTLAELLITMIIAVIGVLMISIPFMAERNFWRMGQARVEARRDAQMVLRAMARVGRSSLDPVPGEKNVVTNSLTFKSGTCEQTFRLGGADNNQLVLVNGPDCIPPDQTQVLIDGTRSRVNQFVVTPLTDRIVRVELEIRHGDEVSGLLQTEFFVRNA